MHAYVLLLRRPSISVRLVVVLLSAVPIGMLPLAVVLDCLARGGSPAAAGTLSGALALGNAAGILAQGALLGRIRPSVLLPASAIVCVLATLAVALTPSGSGVTGVAVAGAALAGAAIPAVSPAVRGWMVIALPDGGQRVSGYALLNVLFQTGVAIGPLAVSALALLGLTRIAAPAAAAVALVAAVGLAVADRGAPVVARAVRAARPRSRAAFGLVLLVAGAGGFGVGVLQVALPAASVGLPLVSGLAFTALAVGEVLGALVVGSRARHGRPERSLLVSLLGMAALYAVASLAGAPSAAIAVVIGLLGIATAAQTLANARLLDRAVRPAAVTAAFAAQIATLLVGMSLGAVVAGAVGSMSALLVPAALLTLVAIAVTVVHTALRSRLGRPVIPAVPDTRPPGASGVAQ